MAERIALGTVQFGMRYGIANTTGQVGAAEAKRILARAREGGIDTLDTAIAYGDSEQTLGDAGVAGWRVVSKLPPVPSDVGDVGAWVDAQVRGTLARLRLPALHALLLHRSADLVERGDALFAALRSVKTAGLAGRIGVSIYAPQELDVIWDRHAPELVQAPFNVLDRRIATSGWLRRMKDAGVEVHTRSAFLQGLLLMREGTRPPAFDRWAWLWRRWSAWLADTGENALGACLAFVLSVPDIDRVVVGVDSETHLREILAAAGARAHVVPADLACDDLELISPAGWRTS